MTLPPEPNATVTITSPHRVGLTANRVIEGLACKAPESGEYPAPNGYNPIKHARYDARPAYCHVEDWEWEAMYATLPLINPPAQDLRAV